MDDRERKLAQLLISFYQHSVQLAASKYNDPAVQRTWAAGRLIRILTKVASRDSQVQGQVQRAIRDLDSG